MMSSTPNTRKDQHAAVSFVKVLLFSLLALGFISGQLCSVLTSGTTGTNSDSGGGSSSSSGGTGPGVQTTDLFANEHVLGNAGASVTVIEYADFDDTDCGRFARETFPVIRQAYVDTGQVRWVFRQFPIPPSDDEAAQASECAADQNRFFDYHDLLFDTPFALTNARLKVLFAQLVLDQSLFFNCLDTGSQISEVQEDIQSGQADGVTRVPSFLIGDQLHVGFMTAAQFGALLDAALSAASSSSGGPLAGPFP